MEIPQNNTRKAVRNCGGDSRLNRPKNVEIDAEAYQKFLDGAELADDQRAEFLEALWSIIVAFIDLGFGVHPVQHSISNSKSRQQLANIANDFMREAA